MSIAIAACPTVALPPGALSVTRDDIVASTVLVTAHGELDAGNARTLVDFVDHVGDPHDALILDLSSLAFFGTEGLWVLNRVKAACAKRGAASAIVAGPEVARVLRVCDPHGALGVVATLDHAVFTVSNRALLTSASAP